MTHQDGMWNWAGEKSSGWAPVWFLCYPQVPSFHSLMNMGTDGDIRSLRLLDSNQQESIRWSVRPSEPQFTDDIKYFMTSKTASEKRASV